MHHTTHTAIGAALAALFPLAAQGGEHQHEGDLVVGRTGAGQLSVEYDFNEPTILLPVSGLFNGWAGDEPGFDHLEADEPEEDFYMLDAGASIAFRVVDISPALVGNPLTDGLNAPNEQLVLGDETLHTHIDWLIDADDPAFDPLQSEWSVDFQLVDLGSTQYGASEVYTWRFTNVPEPAAASLLIVGLLVTGYRRNS